jgi:hypothetical protein
MSKKADPKIVSVTCGKGRLYVEEELAPLVQALARFGVEPGGVSPDAQAGFVEIEFQSSDEANDFLNLVVAHLRLWQRNVQKIPLASMGKNAMFPVVFAVSRCKRKRRRRAVKEASP